MKNKSEKETGICRGYGRMEFTGIWVDRVVSRSTSFIRVLQNLLLTQYFNLKFFINISGEIGRNFVHPPYVSKYTQVKKYGPVPAGYGDFPVSFPQDSEKKIKSQKKLQLFAIPSEVLLRYKEAETYNNVYKFSLPLSDNNRIKLLSNLSINLSRTGLMKTHQPKLLNTFRRKNLNNKKETDDKNDNRKISFPRVSLQIKYRFVASAHIATRVERDGLYTDHNLIIQDRISAPGIRRRIVRPGYIRHERHLFK